MEDKRPNSRWSGLKGALAVTAALCLGAGGGYLVHRPEPPYTRFLNFDAETTPADHLVEGWSTYEASPEGDTFTWCAQNACTLRVSAQGPGERILRLRLFPFRHAGVPPQTISVSLNGTSVATKTLPDGPSVQSFAVPAPLWRKGSNLLRFDMAHAESPKDHVQGSEDPRRLSVALDWLELIAR